MTSTSAGSSRQRWLGWTYDLVAYPGEAGMSAAARLARELARALRYVPDLPGAGSGPDGRGTVMLASGDRAACELDVLDEPPPVVVFSLPQGEIESRTGISPLMCDERENEWRRPLDEWLHGALERAQEHAPLSCAAAGPDAYGDVTREAMMARAPELRQWATLFVPDATPDGRLLWLPRDRDALAP